jgi:hypothetical protein
MGPGLAVFVSLEIIGLDAQRGDDLLEVVKLRHLADHERNCFVAALSFVIQTVRPRGLRPSATVQ